MKYFYEKLHNIMKDSSATFYVYYGQEYSYRDCYRNMLKINSILPQAGEKRIVLYGSKNFETYCAIFSILLSGNTWIPLNSLQPPKRSLDMMKLAAPHLILADCSLPVSIMEYAKDNDIPVFQLQSIVKNENQREFELGNFHKDNTAYIMFTSGSTGIPKGVPMTHENYINFIANAMAILPFDKYEVFADYHDFAFDISIFYLFCCILTESAFAPILKEGERLWPIENIIKNKVTVWSSVPTVIARIKSLRPNQTIETSIKIMFLCGEPLRLDLLRYCYEMMGLENVYNFYGLTETGVENFYHECQPEDLVRFENKGFVAIGKSLKGNKIKISDEKELLLSGCQITPGYLGGVGQEKFEIINEERWFHTGDIVEKYQDVFFCKGRLDFQVKLGGYRIELMDIEVYVRQFPGVEDAVCFIDENKDIKPLACAIETSIGLDLIKLRGHLKEHLPKYMVPSKFFLMPEFPRNKNGKIDRKKVTQGIVDDKKM